MRGSREHRFVALACASVALVGCTVVRQDDRCAGDVCDAIPLPARDVDGTESTASASAASPKAAPHAPDAAIADGGAEAAAQEAPAEGSGTTCDDRTDCPSSFEYCCYFAGSGPHCAFDAECSGSTAQTFFVCKADADCPSPKRCIAQTNTGHRACF
jgi:hypothetical protein